MTRRLWVSESVGDWEIGWCTKHQDLARRFSDGSQSCWWEAIVEANGYHDDGDFMPLLEVLPARGKLRRL